MMHPYYLRAPRVFEAEDVLLAAVACDGQVLGIWAYHLRDGWVFWRALWHSSQVGEIFLIPVTF